MCMRNENAFDGHISTLDMAEERLGEHKDMTIKTSQTIFYFLQCKTCLLQTLDTVAHGRGIPGGVNYTIIHSDSSFHDRICWASFGCA